MSRTKSRDARTVKQLLFESEIQRLKLENDALRKQVESKIIYASNPLATITQTTRQSNQGAFKMTQPYKAGDLLPNGEIYLCRLDDEIFTVAPMAPKKMNWDDAMKYAQDLGLELPDLDITQVMFKKKDEGAFKGSCGNASILWSARRYDALSACYQWLGGGYHDTLDRRSLALSVRPVRRLSIQAFNDLFNVMSVPDAQGSYSKNIGSPDKDSLFTASNQSGDVTTQAKED